MFEIDREHPEYIQRKSMWQCYRDLYAGGQQLKLKCRRLPDAATEGAAGCVWRESAARVLRELHRVDHRLVRRPRCFVGNRCCLFDGESNLGRQFLSSFCDDCDLKGTSLTDFFRRTLINSLVGGASHILIDFPKGAERR